MKKDDASRGFDEERNWSVQKGGGKGKCEKSTSVELCVLNWTIKTCYIARLEVSTI